MRWARRRGIRYYDMVGIPKPENRNEEDPYYGVYRFKIGFGGEVTDFLGCLDLPRSRTTGPKPGTGSSQRTTVCITS
jgi:lipid II:glycine glycyltransferase (peptidoglycan interpeptide bridge formation enzyme)